MYFTVGGILIKTIDDHWHANELILIKYVHYIQFNFLIFTISINIDINRHGQLRFPKKIKLNIHQLYLIKSLMLYLYIFAIILF